MSDASRRLATLALGLFGALLVGCASGPLEREGVATDVTPANAAATDSAGETVLWGGVIVNATNLEERTRLEIVGYPIDSYSQRPETDGEPLGRFLAYERGYLETAEFGRGRRVTVRGQVTGTEQGRVGDAPYTYPTIAIESLELWSERRERSSGPRFHFGIGVLLGN